MKALTEEDLSLCAMQGRIFEMSVSKLKCGSAVFIRRFMNSSLAERLDAGGYLSEPVSAASALEEIEEEYGKSDYGSIQYSADELYWIGYLYRYWCISCDCSSRSVFNICGGREMRDLYYPYHTLDPKQAVERILEAKAVSSEPDLARGISLYRDMLHAREAKYRAGTAEMKGSARS